MAIRMRFLHYPDNKKLAALCAELTAEYENCKFDKLPPAYPCEKERLTVVFVKTGKDVANDLEMFCSGMTKDRSQNVLFICDAPDATVKYIAEKTATAGAKVPEPLKIKFPGLFGGFSEDAKKTIRDYVAKVYAEVQG